MQKRFIFDITIQAMIASTAAHICATHRTFFTTSSPYLHHLDWLSRCDPAILAAGNFNVSRQPSLFFPKKRDIDVPHWRRKVTGMKHTLLIKVCSFLSLLTCLLGLASFMSSHSVFAQRNSLPPAQRFLSSGSSDWTMFDFHDSRFNAQERTLNTTNVSQLSLAWSTALTKMSGGPTIEMVVADGIVYTTSLRVSGHNALVAVREQTGTVLWQHTLPLKDGPMGGHYYLSFADGLVYLNGAASLEAYTAATGTLRWSRAIDPEYGINVEHGVLYVESSLGYPQGQSSVYALDAHTGKTLWSVVLAQNLYSSSPAFASGILYVGSVDGTLLALNATNGHTLWTASLGTNNAIITAPVVDHGIVFVEGDSTGLFAFNATTGKERWFAPSDPYTGSPAVAYGMV